MRLGAILLFLAAAPPAEAQPVVVSPAPDSVSVTIYRDPEWTDDEEGEGIDLDDDLKGYAVVTEVRTVDLPSGSVTVRFEGVASGLMPETAIMRGADPGEKNQDRLLLSERGLIDAYTGQRVTVRRTNRATGEVTLEPARVRSSAQGVVIETAAGFEALRCDATPRALLYPGVPPGLSPKPVLSMLTKDQPGGRVRIELSYLAANFDWRARYVADLSDGADRLDLTGWLVLASKDDTSFADATTRAMAGQVARVKEDDEDEDWRDDEEEDGERYEVLFYCWPSDTTGQAPSTLTNWAAAPIAVIELERDVVYGYGGGGGDEGDIVVTGSRIARREDVGDLKLYTIPFAVTVPSNSQKQAAFLSKQAVPAELIYRTRVREGDWAEDPVQVVRLQNLPRRGLGEPVPGGFVQVFQKVAGRRLPIGEAKIEDKAVGEEVDLVLADAANVSVEVDEEKEGEGWTRQRLTVSNANPFPIRFEAEFLADDETRFERFGAKTISRRGTRVWAVTVRPESKASIAFRAVEVEPPEEEDYED